MTSARPRGSAASFAVSARRGSRSSAGRRGVVRRATEVTFDKTGVVIADVKPARTTRYRLDGGGRRVAGRARPGRAAHPARRSRTAVEPTIAARNRPTPSSPGAVVVVERRKGTSWVTSATRPSMRPARSCSSSTRSCRAARTGSRRCRRGASLAGTSRSSRSRHETRVLVAALAGVWLALPAGADAARVAVGLSRGRRARRRRRDRAADRNRPRACDRFRRSSSTSPPASRSRESAASATSSRSSRAGSRSRRTTRSPKQWYCGDSGSYDAWATLPSFAPVRVAVIDSGVDATHPELAGRILDAESFVGGSAHDGHAGARHVRRRADRRGRRQRDRASPASRRPPSCSSPRSSTKRARSRSRPRPRRSAGRSRTARG